MYLMALVLGSVQFSVVPTAATAAIVAQAAEEPAPDSKPKAKKKEVCRTVQQTGSRMSKRVCRTVEQWVDDADRAGGDVLSTQAKGSFLEGQDQANPN